MCLEKQKKSHGSCSISSQNRLKCPNSNGERVAWAGISAVFTEAAPGCSCSRCPKHVCKRNLWWIYTGGLALNWVKEQKAVWIFITCGYFDLAWLIQKHFKPSQKDKTKSVTLTTESSPSPSIPNLSCSLLKPKLCCLCVDKANANQVLSYHNQSEQWAEIMEGSASCHSDQQCGRETLPGQSSTSSNLECTGERGQRGRQ